MPLTKKGKAKRRSDDREGYQKIIDATADDPDTNKRAASAVTKWSGDGKVLEVDKSNAAYGEFADAHVLTTAEARTERKAQGGDPGPEPDVDQVVYSCRPVTPEQMDQEQQAWDPANFDDPQPGLGQYRYVINAIAEYPDGDPDHITALLNNPDLIEQQLLSCSIIDHTKNKTWSPSGFILKVPAENFVAAKPADMGVQNAVAGKTGVEFRNELYRVHGDNGLSSPDSILQDTPQHPVLGTKHNEVCVIGTSPKGTKVEIQAVFVVVDDPTLDPVVPITLYEKIPDRDDPSLPWIATIDGRPRTVVRPVPGVSNTRMAIYRQIAADRGIDIVSFTPAANVCPTAFTETRSGMKPGFITVADYQRDRSGSDA